jgi:outer membrane protein assembly factor BamB
VRCCFSASANSACGPEASAGCDTRHGGLVISGHADRDEAEEAHGRHLDRVVATSEAVLVVQGTASPPETDRTTDIVALDPATGAERWRIDDVAAPLFDEQVLTIDGDMLRSHDPATGRARWEVPASDDDIVQPVGSVLTVWGGNETRVLDRDDGTVVAAFDGVPLMGFGGAHGEPLLSLLHDERAEGEGGGIDEVELVALDEDGTPRWSQSIDVSEAGSCCELMVRHPGKVVTVTAGAVRDGAEHSFDVATGEPVDDGSTEAGAAEDQPRSWPIGDGVQLASASGPGELQVFTDDGEVTVLGRQDALRYLDDLGLLVVFGSDEAVAIDPYLD